ncbi:hypothetical protein SPI_06709 [Niveomyces insectorum RCEF 264]|uniref:Uncharacterized protein n=1 Tax=Niveomyces insectorum RCEF 264 TaxID=1081102 RepID=A0A167RIN4_9HYPO|nr:hypothetical protein SPI_06709 [Niveomyces insectorum RCEF 264]
MAPGGGFTPEQLALAKELQRNFRASGTFHAEPTTDPATTKALAVTTVSFPSSPPSSPPSSSQPARAKPDRWKNGLLRPLPSRSKDAAPDFPNLPSDLVKSLPPKPPPVVSRLFDAPTDESKPPPFVLSQFPLAEAMAASTYPFRPPPPPLPQVAKTPIPLLHKATAQFMRKTARLKAISPEPEFPMGVLRTPKTAETETISKEKKKEDKKREQKESKEEKKGDKENKTGDTEDKKEDTEKKKGDNDDHKRDIEIRNGDTALQKRDTENQKDNESKKGDPKEHDKEDSDDEGEKSQLALAVVPKDDWKPSIFYYYNEEPKQATSVGAKAVSQNGSKPSGNDYSVKADRPPPTQDAPSKTVASAAQPRNKAKPNGHHLLDDLVDADFPDHPVLPIQRSSTADWYSSESTDLIDLFQDLSVNKPAAKANGKMPAVVANKDVSTSPKSNTPPEVRKALEINMMGKPICWNYGTDAPQVRDIEEAETADERSEELAKETPDPFAQRPWPRAWSYQGGPMKIPGLETSTGRQVVLKENEDQIVARPATPPPRFLGLKASRFSN